MKTTDFINESALVVAAEAMDKESEVQLARQDCFHIATGAIELYHRLKDLPEVTDLDNECVSKLNIAAKYIEEALEYFDTTEVAEGGFTFESAEAMFDKLVNEGVDFDQIRKDADAHLRASMDKQSDDRIEALRKSKKDQDKSFLQKVGDKQIGMVKGAIKGFKDPDSIKETKGLGKCVEIIKGPDAGKIGYVRQIKTDKIRKIKYLDLDLKDGGEIVVKSNEVRIVKEDATAGGTGASSVAAVVGGLGETNGKAKLIKRQGKMSNVLQPPKTLKVKGGY
jgi:hypothetical protein